MIFFTYINVISNDVYLFVKFRKKASNILYIIRNVYVTLYFIVYMIWMK